MDAHDPAELDPISCFQTAHVDAAREPASVELDPVHSRAERPAPQEAYDLPSREVVNREIHGLGLGQEEPQLGRGSERIGPIRPQTCRATTG